jgi:hypothetical protein
MQDAKLYEGQVFCVDRQDWTDCGFNFSKDGENFVIDKESKFKVAWQPIVLEENQSARFEVGKEIKEVFDHTVEKFEGEIETIKSEFETKLEEQKNEFESKFSAQESELAELREYKATIETEAKKDYVNNVENLEKEEKEDLIAKIENYSFAELEDEVAKIVGKKSIKFSASEQVVVDNIAPQKQYDNRPRRSYEVLFQEEN